MIQVRKVLFGKTLLIAIAIAVMASMVMAAFPLSTFGGIPEDTTPPECLLESDPPGFSVQDDESGLAAINVIVADNATVNIPPFTPGTNDPVIVEVTQIDPSMETMVRIESFDVNGNSTICDLILPATEPTPPCSTQVTFVPLPDTFATTVDEIVYVHFTFDARMTNTGGHDLSEIMTPILVLTNGNLLDNADGAPSGVGGTMTVPTTDDYSDGILSPGETTDVFYDILLAVIAPFDFFVDVECLMDADGIF